MVLVMCSIATRAWGHSTKMPPSGNRLIWTWSEANRAQCPKATATGEGTHNPHWSDPHRATKSRQARRVAIAAIALFLATWPRSRSHGTVWSEPGLF